MNVTLDKLKELDKQELSEIFFQNRAIYVQMFRNGEVEARKHYIELEKKAKLAGALRTFKKNFTDYENEWKKERVNANLEKEIDIDGFARLKIPVGYQMCRHRGILKYNDNEFVYEPVFPQAVVIKERYKNICTGEEKNKIQFIENGNVKELIVEAETISNVRSVVKLRNQGLLVTSENAKFLIVFLSALLQENICEIPLLKSVSSLGWHDGAFIPYTTKDIVFDGSEVDKTTYEAFKDVRGNYAEWVEFTKNLRKNKNLRLHMAASFASPLIAKIGALPFVFHIWGGTEAGKTVAHKVSASIWGEPEIGKTIKTMNNTDNFVMNTAVFLNNLPCILDEFQVVANRDRSDQFIMRITEGSNRGRMDGQKNKRVDTWKCAFITNGEEPITKESSGGGTKNRVIELYCEDRLIEKGTGNAVCNFVNENYGFAGRLYIAALENYDLQEEYSKILKELSENIKSTDKQIMSFALMLLADKIASEQIYMDEEPIQMSDCMKILKTDSEVSADVRAYNLIINWIACNSMKFSNECIVESWGKIEGEAIYVNKNKLIEELQRNNFDLNAVIGKWKDRGFVEQKKNGMSNGVQKYTYDFKRAEKGGVQAKYIKLIQKEEKEIELDEKALEF